MILFFLLFLNDIVHFVFIFFLFSLFYYFEFPCRKQKYRDNYQLNILSFASKFYSSINLIDLINNTSCVGWTGIFTFLCNVTTCNFCPEFFIKYIHMELWDFKRAHKQNAEFHTKVVSFDHEKSPKFALGQELHVLELKIYQNPFIFL